jgi:putative FmdB family regulatory protein
MPTYEYECLECKKRFEVFQSINDKPVTTCSACNGKVRKLFGTAGIIFKGSGFYVNDYKKNGASKSKPGNGKGQAEKPADASSDSGSAASCSDGGSD